VAEWGLEYHGCSWNDISRFHPLCVDAKSGQYRSSTSNLFGHCEEIQERFIQGIVKEKREGRSPEDHPILFFIFSLPPFLSLGGMMTKGKFSVDD
jgi:hypothetical protein